MTIEADIKTSVGGDAGLTALISTRLYHGEFPAAATFPLVVFDRIDTAYAQAIDRSVKSKRPRFQFTVYAANPDSRDAVQDALEAAVVALAGSSVTVHGLTIEGRGGSREPESGIYVGTVDAAVLHG